MLRLSNAKKFSSQSRGVCKTNGSVTSFNDYNFSPMQSKYFPTYTQQTRFYSGGHHKLTFEEVRDRVIDVVKAFEKVDAAKVTAEANFQKDLGIDSLDAVELVMALEDEFVIEIPDEEAEKITSCADAINYISTHPHAK